jgi:hypothetical protein
MKTLSRNFYSTKPKKNIKFYVGHRSSSGFGSFISNYFIQKSQRCPLFLTIP